MQNNSFSSRLHPAGLLLAQLWQPNVPVVLACGLTVLKLGKSPKIRQVGHPVTSSLGPTGLFPIISIFLRMSSKLDYQPLRRLAQHYASEVHLGCLIHQ